MICTSNTFITISPQIIKWRIICYKYYLFCQHQINQKSNKEKQQNENKIVANVYNLLKHVRTKYLYIMCVVHNVVKS